MANKQVTVLVEETDGVDGAGEGNLAEEFFLSAPNSNRTV